MIDFLRSMEFGSLGDWVAVALALIFGILFVLAEWSRLRKWFIVRALVGSVFLGSILAILLGIFLGGLLLAVFGGVGWVMNNWIISQQLDPQLAPGNYAYVGFRSGWLTGVSLGGISGLCTSFYMSWTHRRK